MNTDNNKRVLVTAGSKHGATAEIAHAIARRLASAGLKVDELEPDDVGEVSVYDAAVLGSAVYAGRWTPAAKSVAQRIGDMPDPPPVWLFSSGPIGDPPKPEEDPVDVADIIAATRAREHVVFSGKIDKSKLSFGEKAIVVAVRAPEGDYREWEQIQSWADGVAGALTVHEAGVR